MAEQATKEPTMEEILSSIRRIISEDGSPADEAAVDASAADDDDDFLGLGDDLAEAATEQPVDIAEGEHLLSVDELLESETEFTDFEDLSEANAAQTGADADTGFDTAETSLDEVFDEAELDKSVAEIEASVFAEDSAAPAPNSHAEAEAAIAEVAAAAAISEVAAPAEPAAPVQEAAAAPETIAAAAMPAMGAPGNPIENMVSEMMRPMIKEWIDTNLAGIVERKVEAEIQQVANRVVAALRND